jgi:hypothetical protein
VKKIKFIPHSPYALESIPAPEPIKNFIPEWYRRGESFISEETGKVATLKDKNVSGGMKSCVPFLDALMSGYAITSWEDIYVTVYNNEVNIKYVEKNPYTDDWDEKNNVYKKMIDERIGDIGHTIPRPEGHSKNHMIFSGEWGFRLPRGWSALVTHPLNRFDLPFTTVSAIMDSDEWWTSGNIPFFFKENFEGVIPKGTPFAHIIPIKRSSWISEISKSSINRYSYLSSKVKTVKYGWYKQNIWVRKKYE